MAVPQHFSIVVLDVEASGSLSGPEKQKIRQDLYGILHDALRASGVDERSVRREDRGDGVFLLVSAEVSKRRLLDPFVGVLDEALRSRRVDDPPLRLRLVVGHGEAILDDHGSSGPALDEAFAMIDADEVRAALKEAPRGRLALVVPDDLYRSVVHGYAAPDPDAFRMRRLRTKRGRIRTWVTVTGSRVQPGSGRREPAGGPEEASGPVMKVHHGDKVKVKKNEQGYVGTNRGGTVNIGVPPRDRGDD